MLFPAVNKQIVAAITGLVFSLVMAAVIVAIIGFGQSVIPTSAVTATPTKTPTRLVTATALPANTPTVRLTATGTATPSPTNTSTHFPTSIPTTAATLTSTSFPSLTTGVLAAPTAETANIPVQLAITTALPVVSPTLTITQTITPAGTPTATPTPVPRTVLVPTGVPGNTVVAGHLWFTRSFTQSYRTWGSYYYPYGSNGRGQYFWHYGIDIENPHGTTIVASGDGAVSHAGPDDQKPLGPWLNFYGQVVMIEHAQRWQDQPVYTLYGHVSKVLVQPGQRLKAGDPIAEVGQLGVATGPHLHLEVRLGSATYDDTRNPDLWVRPDPGYGVIAGRVVDAQGYYVPQQLVTLHRAESPSRFWRETYTYPDNEVNADEDYFETFTFSDVPAGDYLLKTFFDGRQLTVPVAVTDGAINFTELRQTEFVPSTTPQPEPTTLPPDGQPEAEQIP